MKKYGWGARTAKSESNVTGVADCCARAHRIAAGVLIAFNAIAAFSLQPSQAVAAGHDFTICKGRFALCAASTCTATGKTIKVNVTGGGTAAIPPQDFTRPIVYGPSLPRLAWGTIKGPVQHPPAQTGPRSKHRG